MLVRSVRVAGLSLALSYFLSLSAWRLVLLNRTFVAVPQSNRVPAKGYGSTSITMPLLGYLPLKRLLFCKFLHSFHPLCLPVPR